MSNKIPVQFELPQSFVPKGDPEYIPPISHDLEDAERRRQLPSGSLVLEQQHLGAVAATLFVRELLDNGSHEDLVFGSGILSASLLGSARLSLRGGPSVMRRHLHLPVIADPDTDTRMSQFDKEQLTLEQLEATAGLSEAVYRRKRERGRVTLRLSHQFGHLAGDSGLWVAMLPHTEIGPGGTTSDVQHAVRDVGMEALATTRRLRKKVGNNLSLAMLGGPTTTLSAYVQASAPHGAYNALRAAQSDARKIVDID